MLAELKQTGYSLLNAPGVSVSDVEEKRTCRTGETLQRFESKENRPWKRTTRRDSEQKPSFHFH